MIRTVIAALTTVGGLAMSAPVYAADELELWPTSQWSVEEFDEKCRLSRRFGRGDDLSRLWIEKGGIGAAFNMTLIGRPFRHPYGSKVSVQFVPEPEYSRAYITAESNQGRPVVSLFGVLLSPQPAELEPQDRDADSGTAETVRYDEDAYPSDGAIGRTGYDERVEAINRLRLGGALLDPVTLVTGPLEEPLPSLAECTEKLDEWITRNTAEAASAVQPVELERWAAILQANYPRQMLRAEEEARIGVRLTIGTDGKPSYCEVTAVVGPTSFNDTVCLLMLRHATFEPARDENGDPLVSRYSTRVSFRLNR